MKTIRIDADLALSKFNFEDIEPLQGELKTLDTKNFEKLKQSILKRGFFAPVFLWKKKGMERPKLIDGHQRVRVLGKLKEEGYDIPPIPAVMITAADENDAKKKLLAVTSQYGEVDRQGLYEFLHNSNIDFKEFSSDFRLPEINVPKFKSEFYDEIKVADGEDNVPTVPVTPKTKPGDIYQLGHHKLMCGDSRKTGDIDTLMGKTRADMVFTDPPYGVAYEGGHNEKKRTGIKGDKLAGQDLTNLFGDALQQCCRVSHDHAAFYIWYANGKAVETFASFGMLPLKVRAVLCWYKIQSGLGAFMSQYIPNYEPCIYAFKAGCSPQWFGPTDEKTVWELKREGSNEFHPTQKPVGLAERAIKNSSKESDVVLDVFGGSGSTMIACEKTDRKCFMMELDPGYCDVIVKRYEEFTGRKARLVSGRTVMVKSKTAKTSPKRRNHAVSP